MILARFLVRGDPRCFHFSFCLFVSGSYSQIQNSSPVTLLRKFEFWVFSIQSLQQSTCLCFARQLKLSEQFLHTASAFLNLLLKLSEHYHYLFQVFLQSNSNSIVLHQIEYVEYSYRHVKKGRPAHVLSSTFFLPSLNGFTYLYTVLRF